MSTIAANLQMDQIEQQDQSVHRPFLYGIQSNIRLCCVISFCVELVFLSGGKIAEKRGCLNPRPCQWAHCPVCAAILHK